MTGWAEKIRRSMEARNTGRELRSDVQGGPWTRHGHAVPGITVVGTDRPPIARCGGPGLCAQCALDAEQIRAGARVTAAPPAPVNVRIMCGDGTVIPGATVMRLLVVYEDYGLNGAGAIAVFDEDHREEAELLVEMCPGRATTGYSGAFIEAIKLNALPALEWHSDQTAWVRHTEQERYDRWVAAGGKF